MTIAEEIERLHELRQNGALTDEEFSKAKEILLNTGPAIGPSAGRNVLHQLRRSSRDRVLGGVCGGLGEFTAVPSWCWRVLFCLSIFCLGLGLVLYILLWIFMPPYEVAGQALPPGAGAEHERAGAGRAEGDI
jgi:phage shock protein C